MDSLSTISEFTALPLPPTVRVLLLDFDNTCYRYDPCSAAAHLASHTHLETVLGPVPDFEDRYKAAQKRVKERIPTHGASHSRILYFIALLEDLEAEDVVVHALALERVYWDTFMKTMTPTPGLFQFLTRERARGVTVVIVSDLTTSIQCEKMIALGLAPHVDILVTSEEVGAEKPDPRCFMTALAKAECNATDALMIGDNYERDIEGARACGIPAILITHDTPSQKTSLR